MKPWLLVCLMLGLLGLGCVTADREKGGETEAPQGFVWKSEVPEGCPFERSTVFNRIYFTGRHSDYKEFGEQAYFLNFPSKFISDDGRTLWLAYSANFSPDWNGVKLEFNPPGGRYGLSLHELELLGPEDVK
jgi:hypothetical protein